MLLVRVIWQSKFFIITNYIYFVAKFIENFVINLLLNKIILQVWKVERKGGRKEIYAMKEMSKVKVYEKNSVQSIVNERKLLAHLRHPFIINMHYSFQDKENLYLVMDYLSGGDLRYHICKQKKFDEEQTSK